MLEKILVLGAGFLGSYIIEEFKKLGMQPIATSFSKKENTRILDITNIETLKTCFNEIQPDLVVNCVANTNVDLLEKNSETAFGINSYGAKNVAEISKENEVKLIQISSDSVFDGKKGMYTETDNPNPINVYSKSKLLGEKFIHEICENYVIIRTNFYGIDKNCKFLFNSILSTLQQGKPIIGFEDVIFTPLEVSNLSQLICDVASTNYKGILHLSSDEVLTKYQFCQKIAEIFGFNSSLIKKGSIDDMNFVAKRPKNTSLNNMRSKQIIKTPLVTFSKWLEKTKELL